jgi:hypothetical protein
MEMDIKKWRKWLGLFSRLKSEIITETGVMQTSDSPKARFKKDRTFENGHFR